MQHYRTGRWFLILAFMISCEFGWSVPNILAQSGGGSGGGTGGGSGLGGGAGSGGGSGMGRPVVPRSKSPDAPQLNPQLPNVQSQQRDRAQRLEQQLRQGEVNQTTPQTEMSDRLDQLYKNAPPASSGTTEDRR